MLALADHTILHDHVDDLLKVGFGKLGKVRCFEVLRTETDHKDKLDLTLARYTCVALQRLNGSAKKVKGEHLVHDAYNLSEQHIRLSGGQDLAF